MSDVHIIEIDDTNTHLLDHTADVFDEPVDPVRLKSVASDPSHILIVAVDEGVVVGQCLGVIHCHADKATELYIDDLAVEDSRQRHGIATRMVRALFDAGRRRGCEEIWVATEPDNEAAKGFYASLALVPRTAEVFEGRL